MPSHPATDIPLQPLRLLRSMPAPPMTPVPVGVHFVENGTTQRQSVPTMRPVHYDTVVISQGLEQLPPLTFDRLPGRAPKTIARNAFYTARRTWQGVSGPANFDGPVLDVRTVEPNNVAHLLTDIIPRYFLAREAAGPDLKLLLRRRPVGTFAELLAFFGIDPVVDTGKITADIVHIRGMRGLAVVELFDNFDCYGLHFHPDVFRAMDFPSAHSFDRIFMARRPPRELINQAEVEAVAQKYGYRTLYMEDYTIAEQLGIGAHTQHVIAVHGAAMSFLAANRGIASVVEVFPPNVHHQLFPSLFGQHVSRYDQIVPGYDPLVQLSGWPAVLAFKNRKFAIDAAMLDGILREIHG